MEWKVHRQHSSTYYNGRIEDRQPEAIEAHLGEAWVKLLSAIEQNYDQDEWDTVLIELRPDEGWFVAYPAKGVPEERNERVGVDVYIPHLEELRAQAEERCYGDSTADEEQGEVDWDGDAAYEAEYSKLLQLMTQMLRNAAQREPAASVIRKIRERSAFKVFGVDAPEGAIGDEECFEIL